jgi:catechol 2,3-dioxygenase-like lactoylglutathione lyase family enzyme
MFSIGGEHMQFYRDLLTFLGCKTYYDGEGMLGYGPESGPSLWFGTSTKDVKNDYDGPGLNHVAFGVKSQADVDRTVAYLTERKVPALFETPRHRPEFSEDGRTYYQVMFETPDRILIEVVYTGPRDE